MMTRLPCILCGKLIQSGPVLTGDGPTCSECLKDENENEGELRLDRSREAGVMRTHWRMERTVSRSMILPLPGTPASVPSEMICRIEQGTLRYLELSENLRAFLAQPLDGLLHQSILQYLHQDDRALAEEEFRQICEHGERNDLVLRLRGHTGSWHYMRIYAQARYDTDGRLNHIRCNLKNVTDQVRAEHELSRRTEKLIAANERLRLINRKLEETQTRLVQSEKLAALGTLAAGMAHEINNPLAYAINNTMVVQRDVAGVFRLIDLLQQAISSDSARGEELNLEIAGLGEQLDLPYLRDGLPRLLDSTYKGLLRVAQIVEKLRGFARLDRADIGQIDVTESVDQCLSLLSDSLARLQIKVIRSLDSSPLVRGPVSQFNQAILSIICNAIDAIEATGQVDRCIEIATRCERGEIHIEVSDSGAGVLPADRDRIFDPFFTTKPPGKGAGLGLSTCHGIISRLGGQIELTCSTGTRTTFLIRLPIQNPPSALG
jgi:signal transduction histidine kinase